MSSLRRVVHVVDPEEAGACTLRLVRLVVARLPELEHSVVVVGHGLHGRMAERCGLRVAGMVPAPAGWMGTFAGRAALRVGARGPGGGAAGDLRTVVMAWGERALRVGEAMARGCAGIAAWLTSVESADRTDRWASGAALLRAFDPPACDALACQACRGSDLGWELLEPGVLPPAPGEVHDRATQRQRWGCGTDELVLGLLNEPVEFADARLACYAAAIACVAGRRCRVVLHPRARGAQRWATWSRATGLNGAVVLDDAMGEPWRVAAGLDVALVAGATRVDRSLGGRFSRFVAASPLPVLEAMAAGVPVITEQLALLPAALRAAPSDPRAVPSDPRAVEESPCLAVGPEDRVAIAGLLVRLHDDPAWRSRVARSGRSAVLSGATAQRFADSLRRVLEGVASRRPGGVRAALETLRA